MRHKIIDKEVIIHAAEKLIREEGLKKCSMRRLSRELDVAVGTVYNYYKSHELLLLDVFEMSWSRTIQAAEKVIRPDKSVIEQLQELVDLLRKDIANRDGLGKVLFELIGNEVFQKKLDFYKDFEDIMMKILGQSVEDIEERLKLSRWIILILFDQVIRGESFEEMDYKLIERMIG